MPMAATKATNPKKYANDIMLYGKHILNLPVLLLMAVSGCTHGMLFKLPFCNLRRGGGLAGRAPAERGLAILRREC